MMNDQVHSLPQEADQEPAAVPSQQPSLPKAAPSIYIPLASITPSKTNPRQVFDQAKLAELAESIAKQGVLQPLLVRSLPGGRVAEGKYEIVAGERRYRAALLAKIEEVPCIARTLSDEEALEIQVIENVQRDDLHPMEEAQGYGDLVRLFHHTQEDIAAKVGKSPAYIAQRMKLLELAPPARTMFLEGHLTPSTALIIARIPVADLHVKAAKEITARGGMTTAAAREWIQREYMLDLKEAPFDTKAVDLNNVGPCGTCPKRTGNQAALFADISKGDLCTDPVCFKGKAVAHGQRLVAAAEKSGQRVIKGKEAKTIMPYRHNIAGEFVDLSAHCYEDPKSRTAAQILGKDYKPVLLLNPHEPGSVKLLAPQADIRKALKELGVATAVGGRGKSDSEKAKERAAKIENEARRLIFTAVRTKFTGAEVTRDDLALMVANVWDRWWNDTKQTVAKLWTPIDTVGGRPVNDVRKNANWVIVESVTKIIPQMSTTDLYRLLMDLALSGGSVSAYSTITSDGPLFEMAKRYDVDVAKIRREVSAQMAPKKVKKKLDKPAKKSAAKKAKVKP